MHYTTLLIDLDETVYPSSSGVWDAISVRMEQYMHERLNLPLRGNPRACAKHLYQTYGTTLRGLQITRHVDERDFLDFVHDVPLDRLLTARPGTAGRCCCATPSANSSSPTPTATMPAG